jgi:SAM-dependent methyltransferase
MARRYGAISEWTQMNFGFAELSGSGHTIALDPGDEAERYCHQLYYRALGGCNLAGKDVVEVSSGRGGGASFLYRYCSPRTMTGIDIAASATAFCRRVHRYSGLRFIQGDAEDLPLFDHSADAVINVEASFCYGDLRRFYREVHRVLRPGGYFLYTDLLNRSAASGVIANLAVAGFDVIETTDISTNVLRAIELDAARRIATIRRLAPWYMRHSMRAFAGTPESRIPTLLNLRRLNYISFVLRARGLAEGGEQSAPASLPALVSP